METKIKVQKLIISLSHNNNFQKLSKLEVLIQNCAPNNLIVISKEFQENFEDILTKSNLSSLLDEDNPSFAKQQNGAANELEFNENEVNHDNADKDDPFCIPKLISKIICNLSNAESSKSEICKNPKILFTLTTFMTSENENVRRNATLAIGNLASSNDNKNMIGLIPNIIPNLTNLLLDASAEIRKLSARALANLACGDSNKIMIGQNDKTIAYLIDLLMDKSSTVRRYSAMALGNLSHTYDNQMEIMSNVNAINYLMKLLKDRSEETRKYAIRTLAKLSLNKQIIISNNFLVCSQSIKMLMKLITQSVSYPCKRYSLIVISSIASNPNCKTIISSISSVNNVNPVSVFVNLLKNNQIDIRRYSSRCLANLSCAHHQNKLLISSTENAIEYLIDLLDDVSLDVKTYASRALANLSSLNDNKVRIGITNNSINYLINLLISDDKNVRKNSVWILANLIKNADNQNFISPKIDVAVSILHEMFDQSHDSHLRSRIKTLLSLNSSPHTFVFF